MMSATVWPPICRDDLIKEEESTLVMLEAHHGKDLTVDSS
jgi:hypothetical protein